jgi:hypothetical protein
VTNQERERMHLQLDELWQAHTELIAAHERSERLLAEAREWNAELARRRSARDLRTRLTALARRILRRR